MTITTTDNGYLVERSTDDKGTQHKKEFKIEKDAVIYDTWISEKNLIKNDRRPFTTLVDIWFKNHGQKLACGVTDYKAIMRFNKKIGNPRVNQVNTALLIEYRKDLIDAGVLFSTINRTFTRLKGVFSVSLSTGDIKGDNPFDALPPLREADYSFDYLRPNDVRALLRYLDGDALKIAKVCLSTGAMWSEVSKLEKSHIVDNKIILTTAKTRIKRAVQVSNELLEEITNVNGKRLFKPCFSIFKIIFTGLSFDIKKTHPDHILRHTFASHYLINGGDLFTLQKILGIHSASEIMRYSHLALDRTNEVTQLNPLTILDL
ncbi:phage integrase [Aliivibrio salmonicida]|uniref:phage integrase n=1 Tax=Aliivibrio salmonicida TaxID=40269 RepID=UPI00406D14B4